MTLWKPLPGCHSFSFPEAVPSLLWRVGPSREGPNSRALLYLLGMGSGLQNSLFAASEACPLAEQDALVPPGCTWSLGFPHSSDTTQASPSSIQAEPFFNVPQGLLSILALDSQDGVLCILNTQQWPSSSGSQEPMLPSSAQHSDRDKRLSSCACGMSTLRKVTDGHQDTGPELVHLASGNSENSDRAVTKGDTLQHLLPMGHVHYKEKSLCQVSGSDGTLKKCQGRKGCGHQTSRAFSPPRPSSHTSACPEESGLASCSQQADSCIGVWGLLCPLEEKAALNGACGAVKTGRPCQVERR